jgi:hypothetical protein
LEFKEKYKFIAHNAKGFDSHFILKEIILRGMKPYTVYNGTKLMCLNIHAVNLACAKDFAGNNYTFSNISEFVDWCLEFKEKYKFIAHNAKGFDSHFILKEIILRGMKPYTVYNGTKLMCLEINGHKFIDSCCFMPQPLKDLPRSFGFEELKKGYFPHYFNTSENQDYVGPYPAAEYYGPDTMKETDRAEFYRWYKKLMVCLILKKSYLDIVNQTSTFCVRLVLICEKIT